MPHRTETRTIVPDRERGTPPAAASAIRIHPGVLVDLARVAASAELLRAWTDGYLSGYDAAVAAAGLGAVTGEWDRGYLRARLDVVAELKAAGAELRRSPQWDPKVPSYADRQARIQAAYARSRARDGARSGPALVASARASWGLDVAPLRRAGGAR